MQRLVVEFTNVGDAQTVHFAMPHAGFTVRGEVLEDGSMVISVDGQPVAEVDKHRNQRFAFLRIVPAANRSG